ncbi:MAG: 3-dehydroquinate synthase [Clostridia bacterium]|nr:3-dehydroquinate synthase [Clostridia bacterium]
MSVMNRIEVTFGDIRKDYAIDIGSDITYKVIDFIQSNLKCEKILILSDETVAGYYMAPLIQALSDLDGVDVLTYVINPGESSKSLEVAAEIYTKLAGAHFSRSDLIIALGGGVVGDLTGYVAATYKRGVPFIQMPTTLLSQVDSSVGGKVAVNIPEGKNLIGAFYQPKYVLIDTNYLCTLKEDQWKDGLGEIIKYGFIGSKSLFELLQNHSLTSIKTIIADVIGQCCTIKKDVVLKDEFDTGLRMTLNFGHTLGHAIERYYGFGSYSHGQAVAMGMFLIMRQYELYKDKAATMSAVIQGLLTQYQLYNEEIVEAYGRYCTDILNDKKVMNKKINFIVVDKVGGASIYPLDFEEARHLLTKKGNE